MTSTIDQTTRPRKLNLGSGNYPLKDHINVDFLESLRPNVVHDLNAFPYPFESGAFDRIEASHVLEHLLDPFKAMAEWHRLLCPGGELHIKVPHFSRGFTHPDHKRGFDVSFPMYFNPKLPPWYFGTHFDLKRMRLHWNGQVYLKYYVASRPVVNVARAIGAVIDAVANLSPLIFSRLFSFWVGGFEEIDFLFVRPAE